MTFSGSETNFQIFRLPTHSGLQNYMQEFVNGAESLKSGSSFTIVLFVVALQLHVTNVFRV
jgi:hypothetical protein